MSIVFAQILLKNMVSFLDWCCSTEYNLDPDFTVIQNFLVYSRYFRIQSSNKIRKEREILFSLGNKAIKVGNVLSKNLTGVRKLSMEKPNLKEGLLDKIYFPLPKSVNFEK